MRADYLAIPASYCKPLGLRWSESGDAIEFADGKTFALTQEVRAFLEGYASQRPLVHFGHILHLMYLLRVPRTEPHDFRKLQEGWRLADRPARTAGVLAARLSRLVPSDPTLPYPLESLAMEAIFQVRVLHADEVIGNEPPLEVATFESLIASELNDLPLSQLIHWLKCGDTAVDDEGEDLANELLETKPRSLAHALAEVSRHERLSASVPLVARLLAALSLPPRRLIDPELPLGGYSDVSTRGQPEQILPAQFALDELEFLRRHAERELLYYRREEPSAQTREELVVLVDQGIRTWGKVRLVLAACVFALGKLAVQRKLTLRIASTGNGGHPVDPCDMASSQLADLLAGSDLTTSPALALETLLEQPWDRPRDVILLTQERSLAHPDISSAARRLPPTSRLFVVAATASGEVRFRELRHGLPAELGKIQLDFAEPVPAPLIRERTSGWTGDVEPIGFPFRFGLGSTHDKLLFEFDPFGNWLLVGAPNGLLLALRTDGSGHEMLPRPLFAGELITDLHEIMGVQDGFVVLGASPDVHILAHYRIRERTCRVYDFHIPTAARGDIEWRYVGSHHTVLLRGGDRFWSVHLGTGSRDRPIPDTLRWQRWPYPPTRDFCLLPYREGCISETFAFHWIQELLTFDSAAGGLTVQDGGGTLHQLRPLANGSPALAGLTLTRADARNRTLAVLFTQPENYQKSLWLFDAQGHHTIASLTLPYEHDAFALSPHGRLLAVQRGGCQVQVREVAPGLELRCATPVGRFHNNIVVELGDKMLILAIERMMHVIRWETGELIAQLVPPDQSSRSGEGARTRAVPGRVPGFLRHDRGRFRLAAWHNLIAVVSVYGEVFLFELSGELICGFFAFRQQLAAWMPDGTFLGPGALTGTAPRVGARAHIGQALLTAWERGEKTVT